MGTAALLCVLGEQEVNADPIKNILSSVGVEANGEKLDMVVKALAGKNVDEMVAEGAKMLASMPSGGGGAAPADAAGGAAGGDAPAAKEEKKVEEEEEDEDDDMGFGLFD